MSLFASVSVVSISLRIHTYSHTRTSKTYLYCPLPALICEDRAKAMMPFAGEGQCERLKALHAEGEHVFFWGGAGVGGVKY